MVVQVVLARLAALVLDLVGRGAVVAQTVVPAVVLTETEQQIAIVVLERRREIFRTGTDAAGSSREKSADWRGRL